MIGLINMIREKVRTKYDIADDWCPVSRAQLRVYSATWTFPISRRYYQLLDACPLRIPFSEQHTEKP